MANNRRPQMDYYEYKRRYEEMRRARGGQVPSPPQAENEPEIEEKPKGRGLLGGIKRAVTGFGGRGADGLDEPQEQAAGAARVGDGPQSAPQDEGEEAAAPQEPSDDEVEAIDLPPQAVSAAAQDLPDDSALLLDEDEDERQIDNPFSDAAAKLKQWGGKLSGLGARLKRGRRPLEEDQEEEEYGEIAADEAESLGAAPAVNVGLVLDSRETESQTPVDVPTPVKEQSEPEAIDLPADQARPDGIPDKTPPQPPVPQAEAKAQEAEPARRTRRKAEKAARQDQKDGGEADEEEGAKKAPQRRAFFLLGSPSRNSANEIGEDDEEDIAPSGGGIRLFGQRSAKHRRPEREESDEDVQALQDAPEDEAAEEKAELTRELARELDAEDEVPSRRARRAARATPQRNEEAIAAQRQTAQPDKDQAAEDEDEEFVDEPTQAFRPLRRSRGEDDQRTRRFQPVRLAGRLDEDAEDEDYEDDEDDDLPVRGYAKRRHGGLRVYRDEELDDEDDDYDDDYDESPYDDEEYDDAYDEESVSFGKRLLRFFRGLLIVVLVLLIAVLALRQLEANGRISLDVLRNSIGVLVPLDKVFPTPGPNEDNLKDEQPDITPVPQISQEVALPSQATVPPTQVPEPSPGPTQTAVGVALGSTPQATAQFQDTPSPEAVG